MTEILTFAMWAGGLLAAAILTAIGKWAAGRFHAGMMAEVRDIVDESRGESETHIDKLRESVDKVASDRSAGDRALHDRQDEQAAKVTWLEASKEETNRRLESLEKGVERMDERVNARLDTMENRLIDAINKR